MAMRANSWRMPVVKLIASMLITSVVLPLAAGETQRVLVTFDTGSRAAVVNLSAALRPLGVSILKTSERHRVAVLEGPPDTLKAAAKSLPGALKVELEKPRYLMACDNKCTVSDTLSSAGSNETVPWGVKMVQANSTEAGPESLLNSTVWICVIDTGKLKHSFINKLCIEILYCLHAHTLFVSERIILIVLLLYCPSRYLKE